jgi:hypothetical protein
MTPQPIVQTQNLRHIPCPFPSCRRLFRNRNGLTKHVRTKHTRIPAEQHLRTPSPIPSFSPPPDDYDLSNRSPSRPYSQGGQGEDDGICRPTRVFHPLINGKLHLPGLIINI